MTLLVGQSLDHPASESPALKIPKRSLFGYRYPDGTRLTCGTSMQCRWLHNWKGIRPVKNSDVFKDFVFKAKDLGPRSRPRNTQGQHQGLPKAKEYRTEREPKQSVVVLNTEWAPTTSMSKHDYGSMSKANVQHLFSFVPELS